MSPFTRSRGWRWSEYLLLAAGFLCLGGFVWWKSQDYISQSYSSYVLDQRMRGEPATMTGYVRRLLKLDREQPAPPEMTAKIPEEPPREAPAIPPGGLVGRIEAPRIKVSAIIREGVEETVLKKAAGHIPETPFPGQPGNSGLAAHRDQHFRNLRNVKIGDLVRISTPFAVYEYEVDSLKIVWPSNVEVLDPTPQPVITLVTCYPFDYVGNAPKRFIVRAKQVAAKPPDAAGGS